MAIITTGFFDGVHIGHRLVISELVRLAKERSLSSVVITFWPHPRVVLGEGREESSKEVGKAVRNEDFYYLSSLSEKKQMLLSLGIDRVEVIEFTKDFAALDLRSYLKDYLIEKYAAKAILLGYDNTIGRGQPDKKELRKIAATLSLESFFCPKLELPDSDWLGDSGALGTAREGREEHSCDDVVISSSLIKEYLLKGEVSKASGLLSYDYFLSGLVVEGDKIGRTIGFPTANLQVDEKSKLIPAGGVYLVKVWILNEGTFSRKSSKEEGGGISELRESDSECCYYGMCNIGMRPTISPSKPEQRIESNIFDFSENIYGRRIRIAFIERIRSERRFANLAELKQQLERDQLTCSELMKSHTP